MTHATSHSENAPSLPPRFVSFADQGIYLAHTSLEQHAVIQLLWRFLRPVDVDALKQFRDNLALGLLARLIRPALLPFGRPQWVSAPAPSAALAVAEAPLAPDAIQAWADAQVELPLDPARGPAWTFTMQTFTDGSTVASLVVSHCIADGLTVLTAISEAVRGVRRPPLSHAWSVRSARRAATILGAELQRMVRDTPATVRALAQLAGALYNSRPPYTAPTVSPVLTIADNRRIVFPSVFIRLPLSLWDARAECRDGSRFTLLTAMTAAFAEALGRVRDDNITLLIPVRERAGSPHTGGNGVALANLKVRVGELGGRLHMFQRRLRATLLRTRREPNRLAALLPLVPFVPRRAFAAATRLGLAALGDQPVTCSNLGQCPKDVLLIDGGAADRFCFRGIDHPVERRAIEERRGVATLFAGVTPGFILLSFVAYQPGSVTSPQHLRAIVERLLADYELQGEFFDA